MHAHLLWRKGPTHPEADTLELLDAPRKLRVQEIIGSLLYYARAVDNKLLVALSAIASRQALATVATENAVHLLQVMCNLPKQWHRLPG